MGESEEFKRLSDVEYKSQQAEVSKGTSPVVIAYTVVITVLFITATVLLGIVYFDVFEDDNDNNSVDNPLKDYVYMDDIAYNADWDFEPIVGAGYTIYNINLTSGTWLTPTDSSTYTQYHWLQLCVPDLLVDPSFSFLWITGGTNNEENIPTSGDATAIQICLSTQTLTYALLQVPNQPVTFQGDETQQSRTEDAVIAWTWAHWINNTLSNDWLAYMPMTRAGVRAMDAGQAFWDTIRGDNDAISRFVVGGASKRGWTTWLVGGMGDSRVVGIMPVVAPVANITPQMNEQYRSLGFWSWVLYDYYSLNLMNWLFTPTFQEMQALIDPLTYLSQLEKIKKFQIGGTNDEFFQPDALQWYWDAIGGQKNYRVVAGGNHGLQVDGDPLSAVAVFDAASSYILSFKKGYHINLPTYTWDISKDGMTLTVYTTTDNLIEDEIIVWTSQNKADRDWRQYTCPPDDENDCVNPDAKWEKAVVTKEKKGKYSYTIDAPEKDMFSAFFIELPYKLVIDRPNYIVSTDVSIVPVKQFAYDMCDNCDCGWDCPSDPVNQREQDIVYNTQEFFGSLF